MQYVTAFGNSPCNKAVWVSIEKEDFKFGICSIYAPSDYRERVNLWNWLGNLQELPWVLGVDLNMIENVEDKMGGIGMGWKGNESHFWKRMKAKLNLFDTLEGLRKDDTNIWYSWCNVQKGRRRIYCRLDRFYSIETSSTLVPTVMTA